MVHISSDVDPVELLFQFQFQKTLFIMITVLQVRVLTFIPLFSGTILEKKEVDEIQYTIRFNTIWGSTVP